MSDIKKQNVLVIEYSDIINEFKKGDFIQAYLKARFAPYKLIYKVLNDLFKNNSQLNDQEGINIERIILAGEKGNADTVKIKINKEDLIGADLAVGRLKSKKNLKIAIGKSSEATYEIEVHYKG